MWADGDTEARGYDRYPGSPGQGSLKAPHQGGTNSVGARRCGTFTLFRSSSIPSCSRFYIQGRRDGPSLRSCSCLAMRTCTAQAAPFLRRLRAAQRARTCAAAAAQHSRRALLQSASLLAAGRVLAEAPLVGDCADCIGVVNGSLAACSFSSASCVSPLNDDESHFVQPWVRPEGLSRQEAADELVRVACGCAARLEEERLLRLCFSHALTAAASTTAAGRPHRSGETARQCLPSSYPPLLLS